ncbi:probable serine/threonine-protein kinase DDB_G0291350 isoform X2 [Hydra vulgaris]|uniref:non-specific serine/threonine protein kinase n=1 Tax=Hydra vulgaris TaxID=6087 RepID=A0ABM4D6S8_HYDVU
MGQTCCGIATNKVSVNGISYTVVKDIGEGAFSFVQLVKNRSEKYALKRVLLQLPEHNEMIQREISSHNTIKNKYVMPLIDHEIVQKQGKYEARLLFPYYNLGSVQEMIDVSLITKKSIEEKKIVSMIKCLCTAVSTFHSHNPSYAHRDIKPHNMLIGEGSNIILMDLGSVREANVKITSRKEAMELQELCSQECTAAFRAPELFEVPSPGTITEKTDIWSIGCTMHALAYGNSPCDGTATSAMSPNMKLDNSLYSSKFNSIIKSTLNVCPEMRPTVLEILQQLENIDLS